MMMATGLAALVLLAGAPDLSWMAGTWRGTDHGLEMEETWTAPRGGTLLGVHRDIKGDKTVAFEFLRIELGAEPVYWGSPEGRPPVGFKLVESGPKRVVFANPQHDFPKRILYWLDDAGALHARVEGDGKESEKAMEWTWKRETR